MLRRKPELKKDILKKNNLHCKTALKVYKSKRGSTWRHVQNEMNQKPIKTSRYMEPIS